MIYLVQLSQAFFFDKKKRRAAEKKSREGSFDEDMTKAEENKKSKHLGLLFGG